MGSMHEQSLSGEVVEVFESGGRTSTKVLVKPFYLTIPNSTDAHLGEVIHVLVTIELKRVLPPEKGSME